MEVLSLHLPAPTALGVASAVVIGLVLLVVLMRRAGGQSKGAAAGQSSAGARGTAADSR